MAFATDVDLSCRCPPIAERGGRSHMGRNRRAFDADRWQAPAHHMGRRGWSECPIIDQTLLPHELHVVELRDLEAAAVAIETMQVRGAPLIGATAAYGVCLAMLADPSDAGLERAYRAAHPHAARPRSICAGRWSGCARRCATSRATAGWSLPMPRPPRSATRMSRSAARSASTGWTLIAARAAPQAAGRAGQRADPLQRRVARHHRLGHGHRADLHGAGGRHPDPRLGRRDAAAQPGRRAHRLGTRCSRECRTP